MSSSNVVVSVEFKKFVDEPVVAAPATERPKAAEGVSETPEEKAERHKKFIEAIDERKRIRNEEWYGASEKKQRLLDDVVFGRDINITAKMEELICKIVHKLMDLVTEGVPEHRSAIGSFGHKYPKAGSFEPFVIHDDKHDLRTALTCSDCPRAYYEFVLRAASARISEGQACRVYLKPFKASDYSFKIDFSVSCDFTKVKDKAPAEDETLASESDSS